MISPENIFLNTFLDVTTAISRTIDFSDNFYTDKYVSIDTDLRHTLRLLLNNEIKPDEFNVVVNHLFNKFKLIERDELNLDNIF